MKRWADKKEYIQIVDCGDAGFAIWDFPYTATFYPTHEETFDDATNAAFENGYRPVCTVKNRLIMKNSKYEDS